jgi:predicted ArsR family transcriptional regulator
MASDRVHGANGAQLEGKPGFGRPSPAPDPAHDRKEIFKALGDDTRYAIYAELVESPVPMSTNQVATALGLHPNTIRPHLERMRELGLLVSTAGPRGSVGRPENRYSVAPDAPSLGVEPAAYPLLAGLLANVAAGGEPSADDVAAVGARHGRVLARSGAKLPTCGGGMSDAMTELGFAPLSTNEDSNTTVIRFTHCPYLRIAEAFPDLVCQLHRGIAEGYATERGDAVVSEFGTIEDRDPCRVELVAS